MGSVTRALTLDGNTLSATWKAGETVKVYCNDKEIGTLTAQSDGAETTLSGTLDEAPTAGQDILLCYPKAPLDYTGQKGTLADIAQNFDYAVATIAAADWQFDGEKITTESTVNFQNFQAIVKFTLVDKADGKTALDASSLTLHTDYGSLFQTCNPLDFSITFGDINITPKETTSEIWVSMYALLLPDLTLTATVGTDTYIYERTSEVKFEQGQFYSITVKMESTTLKGNVPLGDVSRDMTVADGATLTGTLSSNCKLTIADGATVTLDGATINGTNSGESYQWAGLTCAGDATIVLADGSENTVKGFHRYYPGIHVAPGHTLTIQGTGALTATSNGNGAGIGGGVDLACGNIVIAGGNITATGSANSAGIGGGNANCGAITISGGTIEATANRYGAGIGSGAYGSCGAITISGTASVTATGYAYGAGIGSGEYASCGTITISGGTVSAKGGKLAAGIGSGCDSASCDGVIITTGVTSVTATKGANDSGNSAPYSIGYGFSGTCGTVTIGCTLDGEGNPVGGTQGMVDDRDYTYTPTNP